jgi:biopolymer transport protein ExbB/TolQ
MVSVARVFFHVGGWTLQAQAEDLDFFSTWWAMSLVDKSVVLLLAAMMFRTVHVFADRLVRFHMARRQSCAFVLRSTEAFDCHRLHDVMAMASKHQQSHIARIATAGLAAVLATSEPFHRRDAIEAAIRSMSRSAARVSADLRSGMGSQLAIAAAAPFIGMFGTMTGIINAFGPSGTERATMMKMIAERISGALILTAIGMAAAIAAIWCHDYLRVRVESFQVEMRNASSEMVTYIGSARFVRSPAADCTPERSAEALLCANQDRKHGWEIPYDRHALVLLPSAYCWFYLVSQFLRAMYWSFRSR